MVGQTKGSKTHRVLMALKNNPFVLNSELNKICFRYSAIIHQLRKEGHVIVTDKVTEDGLYKFTYKGLKDE